MSQEPTKEGSRTFPEGTPGSAEGARPDRLHDLEQVVVRCEAQLRGLQQRVAELEAAHRMGSKRALWFRLGLLVVLLAIYVLVRARYAGG